MVFLGNFELLGNFGAFSAQNMQKQLKYVNLCVFVRILAFHSKSSKTAKIWKLVFMLT